MLSVCVAAPGCVTTLGYIPEHLKPKDNVTYIPTYAEVKVWAFDVVDGYDSRATMNRYAIYFGALTAAAGASALAGLAAFDSGNPAITGVPIGMAFLSGVFTIYSSEDKAQIYAHGSNYIKDLITSSDRRLLAKRRATASAKADALKQIEEGEALCLREDINGVMRKVEQHIAALDPKNVARRLRAVQAQAPQTQAETDTVTVTLPPADFRDLNPPRPVPSVCDGTG